MKRILSIITLSALFIALAGCVKVDQSGMTPDEDRPDGTTTYVLSKVLEKDPSNPNGIDILDEVDFFSSYRLLLTREKGKYVAVEFQQDLPFSTYKFAMPSGKKECYYETEHIPFSLRLKDTDDVVITYYQGNFIVDFQLGCQEISYEFQFKSVD